MEEKSRFGWKERLALSIAITIILMMVMAILPIWDCPNCGGQPVIRWVCPTCGGDGKCSLFDIVLKDMKENGK